MHVDSDEFIRKVLATIPKMDDIDIQMVLYDLYETEYGIYDHINHITNRPLASVAIHPGEDYCSNSLLEDTLRRYIDYDIQSTYGLNIVEFLELPKDIIESMIKIANEKHSKRGNMLSDIEKEFNKK